MSDRPTPNPVMSARGRLANQARAGAPESILDDLRRDLAVAKLEQHIAATVAASPGPTDEQRQRLAALLLDGVR